MLVTPTFQRDRVTGKVHFTLSLKCVAAVTAWKQPQGNSFFLSSSGFYGLAFMPCTNSEFGLTMKL
jgi:hypothetical protein